MKKLKPTHLLCGSLLFLFMSMGYEKKNNENELLVAEAFELLNKNGSNALQAIIVDSPENNSKRTKNITNRNPFFHTFDISIWSESNSPDKVFYYCKIPGAAIVALSCVTDKNLHNEISVKYCKDVTMKGSFTIRTDSKTGIKKIDISDGQNPFSIYLNIVYYKEAIEKISDNDSKTESNNKILNSSAIVALAYMFALNNYTSYFADIMLPELARCSESETFLKIVLQHLVEQADAKSPSSESKESNAVARNNPKDQATENIDSKVAPEQHKAEQPTNEKYDNESIKDTSKKITFAFLILCSIILLIFILVKVYIFILNHIEQKSLQKFNLIIRAGSISEWKGRFLKVYKLSSSKRRVIKDHERMLFLLAFAPRREKKHRKYIAKQLDKNKGDNTVFQLAIMALARSECIDLTVQKAVDAFNNMAIPENNPHFWTNLIKNNKSPLLYLYYIAINELSLNTMHLKQQQYSIIGLYPFIKKNETNALLKEHILNFISVSLAIEEYNKGFSTPFEDVGKGVENIAMKEEFSKFDLQTGDEYCKRFPPTDSKDSDLNKELPAEIINLSAPSKWLNSQEVESDTKNIPESLRLKYCAKNHHDRLRVVISLFFNPQNDIDTINYLSSTLGFLLHIIEEKNNALVITFAGWTAAALGRCMTKDRVPSDFIKENDYNKQTAEAFQKINDELNADIETYNNYIEQYKESGINYNAKKMSSLKAKIDKANEGAKGGIFHHQAKNNIIPFYHLLSIACDAQRENPRFVSQGAIMGLLPYLLQNRDEEADIFKNVLAARSRLISESNAFSFFEVRAPQSCSKEEYAALLKEVLYCANPSIPYADTTEFLDLAEKEIPGVLSLLINYPLRLIDPINVKTDGFYKFEPYHHEMWTNYIPPKNEGQVIKRYHEVLDMTVPNSTGLKLSLFSDIYSVIPVLFHEHSHYRGNPNEASVFLRTQLFSKMLYNKYSNADSSKDFIFNYLSDLLESDPNLKYTEALNQLIVTHYGEKIAKELAALKADNHIELYNYLIENANKKEKWCPEIKYPLLNEKEDNDNYILLRSILIKAAIVERIISTPMFNAILILYRHIYNKN